MRVVLDSGEEIELGTVEASPTIGIIDYSRRVTDDYGVTTVVERGFARRMSVRLAVPAEDVDALQLRLAGLRATPAQWIADDDITWLSVAGFYKDFSIDLAVPPISYCTLTIEGLTASPAFADPGGDPSPDAQSSTLQLLQPITVTEGVLASSSVDEADYPEWAAGTSYPLGARVIKAATHRIYESAASANFGDDPTAASGKWFDVGPTSRWACFDRALGSVTTAAAPIVVALDVTAANAIALLDVVGTSVRVQAPGYDRTIAVGAGPISFFDLPTFTGRVTVTVAGSGMVSVGTLLVGRLLPLGITEASPSAGITDYSRKAVDEFGQVTVSQRAYAKRMSATALIRTDAVDLVAGRIASVRALPSLWIGDAARNSLTVFGFFKDFAIEVGETVSKLSLSIEGLSTAGKVEPLGASVAWPDIADPTGTKPADNATNSADPASPFGPGKTVGSAASDLDLNGQNWFDLANLESARDQLMLARSTLEGQPIGTVVTALKGEFHDEQTATAETFALQGAKSGDGQSWILDLATNKVGPVDGGSGPVQSLGQRFQSISVTQGAQTGRIDDLKTVLIDAAGSTTAKAVLALDVNGRIRGMVLTNTNVMSSLEFLFDSYNFLTPTGTSIFSYSDPAVGGDGKIHMPVDVVVQSLEADSVTTKNIVGSAVQQTKYRIMPSDVQIGQNQSVLIVSMTFTKDEADSTIRLQFFGKFRSSDDLQLTCRFLIDGTTYYEGGEVNIILDNASSQGRLPITPFCYLEGLAKGTHTVQVEVTNNETDNIPLFVKAGSVLEVVELKNGAV